MHSTSSALHASTCGNGRVVRLAARLSTPAPQRAAASPPGRRYVSSCQGLALRLPRMFGTGCGRTDARRVAVRAQLLNGLMASGQKQGNKSEPATVNCRIYTDEGANTKLELLLSFVGKGGTQVGTPVDLSKFKSVPWTGKDGSGKDVKLGIAYEGAVDIPQDAINSVLYLRVKPDAKVEMEYISKVVITSDRDGDGGGINITPNSWIHKAQGGRFFFASGLAHLPAQTPPELAPWRAAELSETKGTLVQQMDTRADWDRIYDYDMYNDLAPPTENRPVLGGSKEHPYPRRTRTGRGKVQGPNGQIYETRETISGPFWVPLDERFNTVKNTNFYTYALLAAIPTVTEAVKQKLKLTDGKLKSFKQVDELYAQLADKNFTISVKDFNGALLSTAGNIGHSALKALGINPDDLPALQLPKLGSIDVGTIGSSIENIKKLVGGAQNLTDFPPPLVVKNRGRVWDTDEEWGRQALAGVHPSAVVAVASESQLGAITEAHLKPLLQGHSLTDLLAAAGTQPRLLVIDHTAIFADYAPKISALKNRYGYSGRAVVFQRDDELWVPAAIELTGSEGQTTVYTPADHPNVWRLAKGVFNSVDSGFHQLCAHLMRCHSTTESYIISTHRNLSSLHPVYKLMMPHWRFTPNINSSARQNLIQAGGIIESAFTPGPYAMEMTSKVYGALWRFDRTGLPADLVHRGLAKKGADGKVQMLLKDYPYADDGMLIWDAVHDWVGKYLRCYYDDAVPEKSITGDVEIQNWWNEIQIKGHPEKTEGWPELKTIDDLTYILTTMIWVVTAHHTAVNYSQYGMSGYFLNRPPVCTKAIPQKGTPEYAELIKSKEAGEKAFLDTLTDGNSLRAVLTVEMLSSHADNEVYLGDPNHQYIVDEVPLKLYKEFAASMRKVEDTINQRNKDPKYKLRNGGTAIPYEFLIPSSEPGITNRGVPQSVSI